MIRVHALGGLSVRDSDGKPLTGAAAQPRRMAVLALLARAADRGMSREKLLALLWPDAGDERGPRTLTQALYALRRDLGADEAIGGAKELRLDPAIVSSDVSEFVTAVARGDDARAASLYGGPFLDGFHVPGAQDFSRWAERERGELTKDYARVLESLARASLVQGRASEAVGWWRKVAAIEPLSARYTMGLMDALVAAGDRAGAVKQAHVYHLLVDQELDLPPDREVTSYAARLRDAIDAPQPDAELEEAPSNVMVAVEAEPEPTTVLETAESADVVARPAFEARVAAVVEPRPRPRRRAPHRLAIGAGVIAALAVIVAAGYVAMRATGQLGQSTLGDAATRESMIAVGRVTSYGVDSATRAVADPVSELLATSLARVPRLRVVSQGRMLELMHVGTGAPDTSAGGFVNAARRAGATELVEGTVYALAGGRLRLDLRRVDLATGAIGDVQTVEGTNVIALVDSGTAHLVAALGADGRRRDE